MYLNYINTPQFYVIFRSKTDQTRVISTHFYIPITPSKLRDICVISA